MLASGALAADAGTATAITSVSAASALNPADAKISKDQAVERTRELFPTLKDANVQSVEFGDPYTYPPRNEKIWTIQWEIKTENGGTGFNSRIDALNGDLLQMYLPSLHDPKGVSHFPPKLTRGEAEQLAKAFIVKAAPSIKSESLQLDEDNAQFNGQTSLFGPVRYAFSYHLIVQGVKLNDSGIQVTLDDEGNVLQYNKAIQMSSLPSTQPKITEEQATALAKEHQDAELQYIPIRKAGNKIQAWWLGYVPSLLPIDAQTGEFVASDMAVNHQGTTYGAVPRKENAFTPVPANGELTAEQAAQIVEEAFPKLKEKKLLQKSLSDGWMGDQHKVWSLNWGNDDARMGPFGMLRANVDAQTGVIISYSTDIYSTFPPGAASPASTEASITKEAALQRAEELINLTYPNASEELKRVDTGNSQELSSKVQNYSFTFQRFYKGIAVNGDNVNVTLDLQGNVSNYYASRNVLDDQVMGAIQLNLSKQQALSKIWESTKLELQLSSFGGYTPGTTYEQPVAKLVYNPSLTNGNLFAKALDATDGTWKPVWSDLTASSSSSVEPTDIDGHWAQSELETMIQYQVLAADSSGKLNPDQPITYGDWLTMMATALTPQYKNYYSGNRSDKPLFADITESSPYFDAVRIFIQQKWLEAYANGKLNAEQALTREALASSLIHILKYNKLSSLLAPKWNELSFTDSDAITNKSDVALAVELGLMEGTDSAFEPLAKVSKAQAAVVMMRLVHLQGKLDQVIGQ